LGSIAELEKRSNSKIEDLHSHFIDKLELTCDSCGKPMARIPQVLDCWFESGAMPYAQAHYPFENKESFEADFPADFIAEGLDQTRGWFYTLLVLSSALFGRPAFKNVVVNGILLAEDGRKMSKSLKNYPPPDKVMNKHGADALRIYMLSSPATRAEELRFSEDGVKQVVRQTLLPLWNAYNFLVTYAQVDNWSPDKTSDEPSNNALDRWIISKVGSLVEGVDAAFNSYHLYTASQPILEFVDQLTNWYIRLNRRRFWGGNTPEEKDDKAHAYATLHHALLTFVRVLAPIAPFISEEIFRNLKKGSPSDVFDSVHLAPFPTISELSDLQIDRDLERTMELFEEVILLGRAVRNDHGIKLRQPLSSITIVYPDDQQLKNFEILDSYIRDELNVKEVLYTSQEGDYVDLGAKLNTIKLGKILGPKLGKDGMKELHTKIRALTTEDIRALEEGSHKITVKGVELGSDDIVVSRTPKKGAEACASSGRISIDLDIALTPELRLEGLAREFINRVQKLRKDCGFGVADRIIINYMTACPRLSAALQSHREYVMTETLSIDLNEVTSEQDMGVMGSSVNLPHAQEIDDKTIIIALARLQS
jgi:isoleucyl-tRNA synthetase